MSLFKKIFSSKESSPKVPKGFFSIKVAAVTQITEDTVEVQLDIPENLKNDFKFIPGQYLNFSIQINGKEERRSYSICSAKNELLSVAIKEIENGKISSWFNHELKAGDSLFVAHPSGNFLLKEEKTVVGIAAGSGITPILAYAKAIEADSNKSMHLFYGNKNEKNIPFKSAIDGLKSIKTKYYLSQEEKDGFGHGRINKESFISELKANLELLKSDGFFICGPEDMIFEIKDVLTEFGVDESKIHYELFTTPTKQHSESKVVESNFVGMSRVKVILEDETFEFELDAKGRTILEKVDIEGADAPYSCRGGVCSTCKGKILKGQATMTLNYSLTEKEVEEGYILTCQAHPASEELIITYDI